ncbi:dolichyl-P-Man:Man(7)GlcNAc(2)-PP-dolichol alpha-1,6-mannosyltransferase [Pneumocystis jirovecii RU7]|uniref:Mannosyltransferase n=1 Tax=Pneumocystis jirovecii (strain RU7) TaxID=1408657 RepID=A0A0W4ZU05_PNEJ7|nr:dolichyl-P-Man:Man(7)GlcNAc(2)-PP-dolichol alpha-1,6-mannosyltransferase [Pneumocystis jirovecii RU7]KTW31808.1 hypothetical protein T551_01069 [Pneumocystis jirovecii RU7]
MFQRCFSLLIKKHAYLDIIILWLVFMYILISPYTKIEERMNLHAVHDILSFGVTKGLKNYDHFKFPEAIPRTFIGPLLISGFIFPVKCVLELFFGELKKPYLQILLRAALGVFNSLAIIMFRHKIIKCYGTIIGLWYGIFQLSQFHIMYYASRTLPNMFAFGVCTSIIGYFLENKNILKGLFVLTFVSVIFRFEIILLTMTYALYYWVCNVVKIREIIKTCIFSAIIGLFFSIVVDSWFWQKYFLWPEGVAFYFNIIEGKSSNWGVSAWHIYFSTYIPKLLLNPLFLVLWGVSLFTRTKDTVNLLVPNIGFALIYSLVPHKEWRFIIYIIPSLTAISAIGAAHIYNKRHKSLMFMIMLLILIVVTIMTLCLSLIMSLISSLNYPGGFALHVIHNDFNLREGELEKIYLDTYTRMTGATLFLQYNEKVIYDRTENPKLLSNSTFFETIDWVISDISLFQPKGNWEIKKYIKGYSGIGSRQSFNSNILTKLCPNIKIENKIQVLKNNKNQDI